MGSSCLFRYADQILAFHEVRLEIMNFRKSVDSLAPINLRVTNFMTDVHQGSTPRPQLPLDLLFTAAETCREACEVRQVVFHGYQRFLAHDMERRFEYSGR